MDIDGSDTPSKMEVSLKFTQDETGAVHLMAITESDTNRILGQGFLGDWQFTDFNSFRSLETLMAIKELDLSYCGLADYPEALSELTTLQELNLKGNECIKSLPDSFSNITNLKKLDLSESWYQPETRFWNGLTHYPEVLSKLTLLEELNLSKNSFVEPFPASVACLTNMKKLNVSYCRLPQFPEVFCQLHELRELDVSNNMDMMSIPTAITNLTNLQRFDASFCGIREYPEVLSQLVTLQDLNLSGNENIVHLSESMINLTHLQNLDISSCQLREFPDFIYDMSPDLMVCMRGVYPSVITEKMVKYWYENPTIWNASGFAKAEFTDDDQSPFIYLRQPPFVIFKKGAKACSDYYCALRVSTELNCSILNVQLLGMTGSGKTSLVKTIQRGKSSLEKEENRTIVVDNVKILQGDILMQISDFGGHELYELTYPAFLKSTRQITLLAVKLPDYNENSHDGLVTKWLSNILAHTEKGTIAIVATQADLCTEMEIDAKMISMKEKITSWLEAELEYRNLANDSTSAKKAEELHMKQIKMFVTSSANMQGIQEVLTFLRNQAGNNGLILPKHWSKMYHKLCEMKFKTERNLLTLEEASDLFWNSLHWGRKLFSSTNDFHQCLQLFHDTGMILWYNIDEGGSNKEYLRDIVFHDVSFVVNMLQCLFRHNLSEQVQYDHMKHGKLIKTKIEFEQQVKAFVQTGLLSQALLKCLWKSKCLEDAHMEKLVLLLSNLDLCYTDEESMVSKDVEPILSFPWFVQREDTEGLIKREWPQPLPTGKLQYTLVYKFFYKIPCTIYEKLCVKIQRHLTPGAHTRQDWKNMVYAAQDGIQILIERKTKRPEPSVQIHLRSSVTHLIKLKNILLPIYGNMEKLCSELPGLVMNSYFLCPHCLSIRCQNPSRRPIRQIVESCSHMLDKVPCDPTNFNTVHLPAALIFLRLLDTEKSEEHLKSVEEWFREILEMTRPSITDKLILQVSKYFSAPMKLKDLGCTLGMKLTEIETILSKYPDCIEEAVQAVLLLWKQRGMEQQREEAEMKEELRTALCSDDVGLNIAIQDLCHYFEKHTD